MKSVLALLPTTALLGVTALSATPLAAEPVAVQFEPPAVEARDVCAPRPPYHRLVARWEGWDGQDFGGRDAADIRRDLRLLRQQDPARWADTIAAANDLLLAQVESYDETDRLLDRIDLLVALGRTSQILDEGLFDDLMDVAPTAPSSAKVLAAELLLSNSFPVDDAGRAAELLQMAAFDGHPAALLELARLSADGMEIDGWGIAPDVAITMAFGAILGGMDPRICDRINRIAAEYLEGDVVTFDPDLAARWLELSVRLGGANAAWELAKLHEEANFIERDADAMLDYLRQAAEFGLPYAQVELAEQIQRGALTERDLPAARALLEDAAASGDPTALTRLARLAQADGDADAQADYLERLLDLPDPPAWAFVAQGDLILSRAGRWAGEDAARAAYERAFAIDPDTSGARLRLARLDMPAADTPARFAEVMSQLRLSARANGRTEPMRELHDSLLCRSPGAPETDAAAYWTEMEAFSGDVTIDLEGAELSRMAADPEPLLLAQIQTQALNARTRPLIDYLTITDGAATGADVPGLLWFTEAQRGRSFTIRARTALARGDRADALAQLEAALEAGEPDAAMRLARLLSEARPSDARSARIVDLVAPLAERGNGEAIALLVRHDPALDARGAWQEYRDAIDANGDFDALLFAIPFIEDQALVDQYRERARAVMNCDTRSALSLATVADDLGDTDAVLHWLGVAEAVAEGSGWQLVAVADALRDMTDGDDTVARAADLYRAAVDRRYPNAMYRLLTLREAGAIEIATAEAADLFIQLLTDAPVENIPNALSFLGGADAELRAAVEPRIDRRALYEDAAEAGHPVAQLELAKLIRDDADGSASLDTYADLLRRAADQGNDEAMLLLSEAYSYGLGVQPSAELSRESLLQAAEAGNEDAVATARMIEASGRNEQ